MYICYGMYNWLNIIEVGIKKFILKVKSKLCWKFQIIIIKPKMNNLL